jgi:ADP-ribose pyrophosphatase YjhB (NUDIX family)
MGLRTPDRGTARSSLRRGWRTWHALLYRLLPDLPSYDGAGGPVIPQAVILRPTAAGGAEVLLVKRTTPRAWELPGGFLDAGETNLAGLLREAWEETGLHVRADRLVGWYDRTGFRPHKSPVYACTPVAGTVRRSSEAVAIGYFPVGALPLGLFPWYRKIIRDAAAGVTYEAPQVQYLGLGTVLVSAAIHVGGLTGLLRP